LPFDCQKIAKILTFIQKNCQKKFFSKKLQNFFFFFQKKLPKAIFLKKKENFWQFFFKCQVFGNFLTAK